MLFHLINTLFLLFGAEFLRVKRVPGRFCAWMQVKAGRPALPIVRAQCLSLPSFDYCHVAEKHKWPSPLPRISRLFSEDHFVFLLLRSWLLLLGNWKMPTSSRWYLHTENGPWFHWASDLDFKGRSFIHFASRGNAYSWVVLFASALYFCTLPLF